MSVLGTKRPLEDPTYSASQRVKENEKASAPPSNKLSLPAELIAHSLSFLKPQDQATAALVSREFAEITPIAMRSSLYNKYDSLLQWLSPLTELLPEAERNLPVFERFTLVNQPTLSDPFRIIKELREEYEEDLAPAIAILLHRSLGLPLEKMAPLAIELLSNCDSKNDFSTVLHYNIFIKPDYQTILYSTEASLDKLLLIIPKLLQNPIRMLEDNSIFISYQRDAILNHMIPKYLEIGMLKKALAAANAIEDYFDDDHVTQIIQAYGDLSQALAACKQTPDIYRRCQNIGLVVKLYEEQGDLLGAINAAQELPVMTLQAGGDKNSYTNKFITIKTLFQMYMIRHEFNEAFILAKSMPRDPINYLINESGDHNNLQSALLHELSITYENQGNLPKAIMAAKDMSYRLDRNNRMSYFYNIYFRNGDLENAFMVTKLLHDSSIADSCYSEISASYEARGDLDTALRVAEELDDPQERAARIEAIEAKLFPQQKKKSVRCIIS